MPEAVLSKDAMEFIGQTILNGLMTSSFYALIAVGLSLVFGVMHIVTSVGGSGGDGGAL